MNNNPEAGKAEAAGDGGQGNNWERTMKDVKPFDPNKADRTVSDAHAENLVAVSKENEAYAKKSFLEKLKAKIKGEAPDKTYNEYAEIKSSEARNEAIKQENIEAGATEADIYPDRVADIEEARAMAEASNKFETKAAEYRNKAEAAEANDSDRGYVKNMNRAYDMQDKAESAAAEASEKYREAQDTSGPTTPGGDAGVNQAA